MNMRIVDVFASVEGSYSSNVEHNKLLCTLITKVAVSKIYLIDSKEKNNIMRPKGRSNKVHDVYYIRTKNESRS